MNMDNMHHTYGRQLFLPLYYKKHSTAYIWMHMLQKQDLLQCGMIGQVQN